MKDKFYYGLIYGSIGGIIMNGFNLTFYYFDIVSLRYLDWMALMIYGTLPYNTLDGAFALMLQIGLTGFLGILFTYLLPVIGYEHYIVKGLVFSSGSYLFFYSITTLFQVPGLEIIPPYTAMFNFGTVSIFGVILAVLVKQKIYGKK
jgi:hypothetical protein